MLYLELSRMRRKKNDLYTSMNVTSMMLRQLISEQKYIDIRWWRWGNFFNIYCLLLSLSFIWLSGNPSWMCYRQKIIDFVLLPHLLFPFPSGSRKIVHFYENYDFTKMQYLLSPHKTPHNYSNKKSIKFSHAQLHLYG